MQRFARVFLSLMVVLASACHAQSEGKQCTVAIDTGHSPTAQGATSSRGVEEFNFNQNMAKVLLNQLLKDGTNAFLIDTANKSLQQRTSPASLRDATLLISIHHDSVQPKYLSKWTYEGVEHSYSDRFHGYSLFVSTANPHPDESLDLAHDIGSSLLKAGFTPSLHHAEQIKGENRLLVDRKRGIYDYDDLIILKTAPIPAVLLECGVIVNRQEESRLSDPAYQQKLAQAVAAGIKLACQSQIGPHP